MVLMKIWKLSEFDLSEYVVLAETTYKNKDGIIILGHHAQDEDGNDFWLAPKEDLPKV